MKRLLLIITLVAGCLPASSFAVELKNLRGCYGKIGAPRPDRKAMPGDWFFLTYEIDGLMVDPKSSKTSYTTLFEFGDDKKNLVKELTANDQVPQFGGTSMPGEGFIILPHNLAPGKYTIKLTVQDKLAKTSVSSKYDITVAPPAFGMIRVVAPAFGLPGGHYGAHLVLANTMLDKKTNLPNVEVTMRLLDARDKAVAPAVKNTYPFDLPLGVDLTVLNEIPLSYPLFVNRPGRYTMEIVAQDKLSKQTATLRYPITILDLSNLK